MLYPILDTDLLARHGIQLPSAVCAALDCGASLVQIRHKGDFTRDFVALLQSCPPDPRLILNDRADYARLLNWGLHLGQDDLPPRAARAILGPGPALGWSTHNREQIHAAASEPLSYLALGPIFPTTSKANPDPVVGLDKLRAWRTETRLPLVAIGGITLENAQATLDAGADFLAILSAFWPPPYTLKSFSHSLETWRTQLRTRDSSKA